MKRHKHFIVISVASGLLLTALLLWGLSPHVEPSQAAAPAAPQQEAFWEEDFSEDPEPGTYYISATLGSGEVMEDYFRLTQNATSQTGRIFYRTLALMDKFYASFHLYLGTNPGGGDGAAFIFCPYYDYDPIAGGSLDASCPYGYIVAFDTYDTNEDIVYLAYNSTENILTDEINVGQLEDGEWHEARVLFNQGTITVTLDGSNVITGFTIPEYEAFSGYFGFSAATGGATNEQRVDEINIVPLGQLDGYVYDAETLAPIEGATVTGERQEGGWLSAVSDSSGYYSMTVGTGTYTVTAETETLIDFASGVQVQADELTTQDLYLIDKVTFEPTPLHVTLDWQTTDSVNATLFNDQPWAYDFEFLEWLDPDVDICANTLCEETYGSPIPSGSGLEMDIGNFFEATEDTVIHEIRAWLNFSAPTDMYFFVYEDDALTGGFNKIFDVQVDAGTGAQWHSSGPIYVQAQAGKFYYVGASWNGLAQFYQGNEPAPFTTSCFGILRTGGYYLTGYPPAENIPFVSLELPMPPYYFAVVTSEDVIPWFGQEPLTGTLLASNSEPGELTASMLFSATYAACVDQPGDYSATLMIDGDPTLQVPVIMTVLPPAYMGSVTGGVMDNCTGEPIEEVQVSILGGNPIDQTWTNESGNYTAWLFPGSYELTFFADGYQTFTDLVEVTAGEGTIMDVNLVPERACIEVNPQELEAWVLTDTPVYTHPFGLDFINYGSSELSFAFGELPGLVTTNSSMGIASLSGSFVEFDPSVGGDAAYIPGTEQTFCFRAESYTDDEQEVIALWQRFPTDWIVSDVYVQGTPACDNGGTWDTFNWVFWDELETSYEILILHPRLQAENDHCTAYYCFEVTSGAGGGAPISWYWLGEEIGTRPFYPCSDDQYTPSGLPTCDEWDNPQAYIPSVIDIPWLWEQPASGTVPALSTSNVDILFSSEITEPLPVGNYSGMLLIFEDDPVAPNPQLPVSMHVVEEFVDPLPFFESNSPVHLGETAIFTNTSLEGVPPTEYYLWDFGDGMTITTTDMVTHNYTAAGSYMVSLTAHQLQTDVEVIYTEAIVVIGKIYLPLLFK